MTIKCKIKVKMKILSSSKKNELVCRCIATFGVPGDSEFIYPSRKAELKFARFKRGTKKENYAQGSNMRDGKRRNHGSIEDRSSGEFPG